MFSLLLTVILIGIGAGSFAGGFLSRRPAQWLMVVQGLFVAATLLGLAAADARNIDAVVTADSAYQAAAGGVVGATLSGQSGLTRSFTELWFNLRPMLLEVGLPALLMGFAIDQLELLLAVSGEIQHVILQPVAIGSVLGGDAAQQFGQRRVLIFPQPFFK